MKGRIIFWGGGRISNAKGAVQILKATKIVKNKISEAVLVVAGDKNSCTDEMETLAKELDISVVFTGRLDAEDMKIAYAACDVSVTPSICFDSFPNVNLEAMAAKKPVVATCFGGSREAVIDGETGYIVDPNNVSLMAEKILDLLENPEKAKRFGLAGYERVKKHFSVKEQVRKTLCFYDKNFN